MIRNSVTSSHIVTHLANRDIVTLTFWTFIRKVLSLKRGAAL